MSLRLTNVIRDAFINSVMNDVPKINFTEQIRALVLADAVNALPPAVRAVYDDPKTRGYLRFAFSTYSSVSVTYPSLDGDSRTLSPSCQEKVNARAVEQRAQTNRRDELRSRLRSIAYGMTTRKALAAALPEFEKYLPEDEAAACRTLPVVANVVADFVRAGWGSKR